MDKARKVNILLVDDRPENLITLQAVLDELDQNLVLARSGEEALRRLLHDDFAIIVMDVQMPGLNGFETAKIIKHREKTRFVPIIFVTAISKEDAFVTHGYQMGAVDYLFKPFDPQILKAKISVFIDLYNAREDLHLAEQREHERQVADLKRAAAAQVERLEYLQQVDKLKDQFLSILSHELRTPLNAITGFGSILVDGLAGPLTDQQREYVKKMLGGSEIMLALVDDLLDMSRIQAGKFKLAVRPMQLYDVAEDVIEHMEALASQSQHGVINEVPPELPQVVADPQRVGQVLTNLLNNALKFAPGGGEVHVRAHLEPTTGQARSLVCEVEDEGVGIAPEDIPRLFTLFTQLDMSDRRQAGGTGLGLSISKALIEAHGGKIGVRSTPDHGSTFWFSLPLEPVGAW